MTAEIINLRRVRRARQRLVREADASAHRRKFGQSKEEKARLAAEKEKARRLIEGHRREPEAGEP